jgi:hypothetical protein
VGETKIVLAKPYHFVFSLLAAVYRTDYNKLSQSAAFVFLFFPAVAHCTLSTVMKRGSFENVVCA